MRLIEAGLQVFGTVGVREATVGAVCAEAHLTQRYFYESFRNLQVLLAEVFTVVTERQHRQMAAAATGARRDGGSLTDAAHAALRVYFSGLQADPRIARLQLLEMLGSDEPTDRCYQAAIRRAADLVLFVGDMREVQRPAVPRLLALGLIGAVVEIALMWLLADFADPLEAVVASALVIYDAVISAESTSPPVLPYP
ncbi:MAG TPA: TetR family transcriptional regulator [Mycobacteriales bacterium]|nr:TetR family transcriptional regulator [Mycobacteriales bacterium]